MKISRVGGKISRDSLPPGGQAVQGGKINCYTGGSIIALPGLRPSELKREMTQYNETKHYNHSCMHHMAIDYAQLESLVQNIYFSKKRNLFVTYP